MDDAGIVQSFPKTFASARSEDDWLRESLELHAQTHDPDLRDEIARRTSWIAVRSARRFCHRGEPFEDLVQVANIGLLKAIDRFIPSLGLHFGAYATPTTMGELRRHFRDYTWSVHVPRQTKDLRTSVTAASNDLTALLGYQPNVSEIAAYLSVSAETVVKVLEANNAYRSFPLEQSGWDRTSSTDPGFDGVLNRELIADLLHHLPPRQQMILYLQYFEQLSQEEIAKEIGISQVHVSRLISASLEHLRRWIGQDVLESAS